MTGFKNNKISWHNDLVGEELKRVREDKGVALDVVAKDSGINQKYLEALESGRLDDLPEGIYGRKIIEDYASFLGVDSDWLVEVFIQETDSEQKKIERCRNAFRRKFSGSRCSFVIPKILKGAVILLAVAVCAGYLSFYIKNVVSPPELVLSNPAQDQIIAQPYITVQGSTESEAEVMINGKSVLAGPEGIFQEKVNLKKGLNVISVSARTKYSRLNKITKKIIFRDKGA